MASTMMFPHTAVKFTGLTVLNDGIVKRRLATIYRAIMNGNLVLADRVLKDTIRVFRTAKNNQFDFCTHNYLLTNMLRMAVELHLLELPLVTSRMHNMYISLTLPDDLY